jgi:hypothetical protein
MSIEIGTTKSITGLSAAQEKALSEVFQALPEEARQQVIEKFTTINEVNARVEAETTRKKTAIDNLKAKRADKHQGGQNELGMLDGALRRANVEPLESLATKEHREIHSIIASADKLSPQSKFAVKSFLYRIGAIPA